MLAGGCLPIRIDAWRRNATIGPPAYPFPDLIDWSRLVIDISMEEVPSLLNRLLAMRSHEIKARQAYLRRVAHWLHYDQPEYSGRDAAAALVRQIERRLTPARAARASYRLIGG